MFFDEVKGKTKKEFQRKALVSAPVTLRPYAEFDDTELLAAAGSTLVFDIECYPNYFLIAFKSPELNKVVTFERSPVAEIFYPKLVWLLAHFKIVGFNSRNYDMPLLYLAIRGFTTQQLKNVSDRIIIEGLTVSQIEIAYDVKINNVGINHIDLIEVAPLQASLKTYAGRLHAPRMQDLPIEPDKELTPEQAERVKYYCINDLDNTGLMWAGLRPQIELREQLGREYGQDLRSRSDAQIAEYVLSAEIEKRRGSPIKKPKIEPGTTYKYNVPEFIQYQTPQLQRMLETVRTADFVVAESGSIEMPQALKDLKIAIGASVYRMGIGGLHSSESSVSYVADDENLILDDDVASYYPNIILNQKLYPQHLGEDFLIVYRKLVDFRLSAKKAGDKVVSNSIKIVINGSFGKLGNKYSYLYSPDLLIQVTITGQLALLMLIEALELAGFPVISANTDGVVKRCPVARYDELRAIIKLWEAATGFETEETRYQALYSRDVNNYIAVKEKGGAKGKGAFGNPWQDGEASEMLKKNPETTICVEAVTKFLIDRTPVEATIRECQDIKKFVSVRNVKGGAEKDGVYLGKSIRWYYAKEIAGTINYVMNGNKVPKSEGAKPLMDLPDALPDDIDYQRYINECVEMLNDLAYYTTPTLPTLW